MSLHPKVLPTNLEHIHEAYNKFKLADAVWQNCLEYTFGKRAGDMRYTIEGKTHPDCAVAYKQFVQARDAWFQLTYEGRTTISE